MYYGEIKKCDIANGPGESAYSYQAAEIIVQDALIRRHGTFVMESHLRRRQKIISWNC